MNHKNICNLTVKELEQVLITWGQQRFHAKQIFTWIYKKGIRSFDKMSDLSASLRRRLKENFYPPSQKTPGLPGDECENNASADVTDGAILNLLADNPPKLKAKALQRRRVNKGTTGLPVGFHFELSDALMNKLKSYQQICLEYLSDTRIMPQMHKILKMR